MIKNQDALNKNKTNLFAFRSHSQYINFCDLFLLYFKKIPNTIFEENIDCEKANIYFSEKYKDEINETFYYKRSFEKEEKSKLKEIYYVLDSVLIVFFTENNAVYLLFTEPKFQKTQTIIYEFLSFRKRSKRKQQEIDLLINSSFGISTTPLKIIKPKLKIEDNYNDDFIEIHKKIIKRLSKKNDKGIVLLHGKPGTGKTSYIRFLISSLKKKIIFLPPNMASELTNPDLLTLLIDNPNSIFIIEDAENVLMKRDNQNSSAISALLNISDGLLSDCLNIQIICSFNTDLSKVDNALLRKGRLIAKYEFKELKTEKAQQLSDKLGFQKQIIIPTILTDIYNQKETGFKESKNKIGF